MTKYRPPGNFLSRFCMIKWLILNSVAATSYCFLFYINLLFFDALSHSEFIGWIFLPAGLRLFFVIVYRYHALAGLLVGSLLCSLFLATNESVFFILGIGLASTLSPLFALLLKEKFDKKFSMDLHDLGFVDILSLAILQAFISTVFHHVIFLYHGQVVQENFLAGELAMFFGDLFGIVIMLVFLTLGLKLILKFHKAS